MVITVRAGDRVFSVLCRLSLRAGLPALAWREMPLVDFERALAAKVGS